MKLYHGTARRFKQFSQNKARVLNDYYGGGIAYFTSSLKVAKIYARAMKKMLKTDDALIYEVEFTPKKIFDVDHKFTGKELTQFLPSSRKELEEFARGAGLIKLKGLSKFVVLSKLEKGDMTLTGDQIFKGLSRGQVNSAKARQLLIKKGYDCLRYNGGTVTNMPHHDVYIAYKASDIKINKRMRLIKKNK